ncbi:hypothetical protein BGZ76_000332 [Entomortierella beljakovae]|nr:hypothetical protein BGZ76_000332 [Entomortierella beljakovae]
MSTWNSLSRNLFWNSKQISSLPPTPSSFTSSSSFFHSKNFFPYYCRPHTRSISLYSPIQSNSIALNLTLSDPPIITSPLHPSDPSISPSLSTNNTKLSTNTSATSSTTTSTTASTTTTKPSEPSSSSTTSSSPSSTSVRLRIQTSPTKSRKYLEWTPELDDQLLDLRSSQGKTWKEIGEILNCSRQVCNRRYDAILNPESGTAFWEKDNSKEKILILKTLKSQNWSWNDIAIQLGTRASSCEKQWRLLERIRLKEEEEEQEEKVEVVEEKEAPSDLETKKQTLRFRPSHIPILLEAVKEYGTDQWETISSNAFQSKISPQYLKHQYLQFQLKRRKWTAIQDIELEKVVENVCSHRNSEPIASTEDGLMEECHWKDIANSISGEHTSSECRERWIKLQLSGKRRKVAPVVDTAPVVTTSPAVVTAPVVDTPAPASKSDAKKYVRWTPEQSQRLEDIVHILQQSKELWNYQGWVIVAKEMNHEFTRAQCKARWNRLERELKHDSSGRWSRDEIEGLIKGIDEFGYNWTRIKENRVPGRTPSLCQGKWSRLKTKIQLEMKIRRRSWNQVCADLYGDEMGLIMSKMEEISTLPKKL